MNGDVGSEIDRLYGVPLDRFVAERTALARRLKQDGDPTAAAEVAALRKPSLVAWTVNQLAHRRRRDIDLLLDAGKRIIDAQQTSLTTGARADLDTAQAAVRKAVDRLMEPASEFLADRASRATLARVADTLRSAATSPVGRELLARGRLTEELDETGWEVVASLTPRPSSSRLSRRQPGGARRETELETRLENIRRLEKSRAAAAKRLRDARRKEEAAIERLETARAASAAASAELSAIEREIGDEEHQVDALRGKA